ncbi:hypothetical protein BC937DRAFT_92491 [Endogone sp. FLAS-F59071]|nr:hypothetical protein BC937DRAFT_92491 [Endogone sp. FLAS-F59071]|eukprot:RUS15416.1 hypothetical protein BC937DRAFT_92491 [Endogone sp. FLAS-F59071]
MDAERKSRMDAVNPKFVLRNWVAQEVIAEFENEGEEKGREALKQAAECCLNPFREEYEGDWAKSGANAFNAAVARERPKNVLAIHKLSPFYPHFVEREYRTIYL